jgi:hypothetical protein
MRFRKFKKNYLVIRDMETNKYKTFPKMKSSQTVKKTSGTQKVTKCDKDFRLR